MAADRSDSFDAHTTHMGSTRSAPFRLRTPDQRWNYPQITQITQISFCSFGRAEELKKTRYRQMVVLAHRESGTKKSNLRNLCNLRILKVFQVGNEMVNKSGINGLHCSKVHASHEGGVGVAG